MRGFYLVMYLGRCMPKSKLNATFLLCKLSKVANRVSDSADGVSQMKGALGKPIFPCVMENNVKIGRRLHFCQRQQNILGFFIYCNILEDNLGRQIFNFSILLSYKITKF